MNFVRKLINANKTANISFAQFRELRKLSKTKEELALPPARKLPSTAINTTEDNQSLPTRFVKEDELKNQEKNNNNDSSSLQKSEKNILDQFAPTFNISAYLNKSETLQELFKLGVDFSRIEKRKGIGNFLIKLDFEKDIKQHLVFLNDIGIKPDNFGEIITKNPLIFKICLDDLQVRINYLEGKNFKSSQIERICTKNPFWLMFSTKRIDKRLGYFQKEFKLSGDDIRFLATKQPKLITYHMESIEKNTFCIREEMGFEKDELKCLILSKPRLWMMNSDELIERFDYVHNKMNLSHDLIVRSPEILTSREFRLRQRHEYLKLLGRAQYDCEKPLYVSLKALVEGNDEEFVLNIAKADMRSYDLFLKTL